MRRALALALFACVAATATGGCVLDASNVSTKLVKVCTHGVPLTFTRQGAGDTVASLTVENVGTSADAPDAQVVLDTLTLTATSGADDFGFADSLAVVATSPGLPDADIAALQPVPPGSPLVVPGDPSVNMAPYITSTSLEVRLDFTAPAVPAQDLHATLDACLDVDGVEISD